MLQCPETVNLSSLPHVTESSCFKPSLSYTKVSIPNSERPLNKTNDPKQTPLKLHSATTFFEVHKFHEGIGGRKSTA